MQTRRDIYGLEEPKRETFVSVYDDEGSYIGKWTFCRLISYWYYFIFCRYSISKFNLPIDYELGDDLSYFESINLTLEDDTVMEVYNSWKSILTFKEIYYLAHTIEIIKEAKILDYPFCNEADITYFDTFLRNVLSEYNYRKRLINKNRELYYFLEERGIFFLCHFTPKDNLSSIFTEGLLTRDKLTKSQYTSTDKNRFDELKNALCLSISKPNKFMFDKKNTDNNLALILLKIDILFDKKCLYFQDNAASKEYHYNSEDELFKKHSGIEAFKSLFAQEFQVEKAEKNYLFSRSNQCLSLAEPTSAQAEIQCLDNIGFDNIITAIAVDLGYYDTNAESWRSKDDFYNKSLPIEYSELRDVLLNRRYLGIMNDNNAKKIYLAEDSEDFEGFEDFEIVF